MGLSVLASMGPRSNERGNAISTRDASRNGMLQWGRVPMNAEIFCVPPVCRFGTTRFNGAAFQ